MNYNAHYHNGNTPTWSLGSPSAITGMVDWRTASLLEAQSRVLASDPFVNRASSDFRVSGGHEAKTASSTGGEVGAYEGSITPGPYGSYGF